MQKLVFRNANGVELDLTSGDFGITEWIGFSADDLNIQSQQVPFQDGAVFLDALMTERELSVTVAMQDNNNLEKRYQLRRQMISTLNPKLGEGVLIYTNDFLSKQIHCIPQLPVFENHNSNDSGTPKASCSFTACNPYWEDLEDTVVELTNGVTTIINDGDVPVGFEVEIVADNNTSIGIENNGTGKKIEIVDDIINYSFKISTETGKKTVEQLIPPVEKINFLTTQPNNAIFKIAYSPDLDLWVGIGETGNIYSSEDKLNWTAHSISSSLHSPKKVIWNNRMGKFFAIYLQGVATSSDGTTWESYILSDSSLQDVCFNNLGTTYIAGTVSYSTIDGENFTEIENVSGEGCVYNHITGDVLIGNYLLKNGESQWVEVEAPNGLPFVDDKGNYCFVSYWEGFVMTDYNFNVIAEEDVYFGDCGIYDEKNKKYYIKGTWYNTSDSFFWASDDGKEWNKDEKFYNPDISNPLQKTPDGVVYAGCSNGKSMYEMKLNGNTGNIVDKLSPTSDMGMRLEIGANSISLFSSPYTYVGITAHLKYRQKYIGV